jgi:hypothetical protein
MFTCYHIFHLHILHFFICQCRGEEVKVQDTTFGNLQENREHMINKKYNQPLDKQNQIKFTGNKHAEYRYIHKTF